MFERCNGPPPQLHHITGRHRLARARAVEGHPDEFGDVTVHGAGKCMRGLGIRGKGPRAGRQTTVPDEGAPARPDPMGRDLAGPVPTHGPVGDTAYPETTRGLACLAVAAGLATRMVVGRGVRDNMRAGLVAGAIEMARPKGHEDGGAILRGDRGSQHAGLLFARWAAENSAGLSVGRTGPGYGDAVAESFFGTPENDRCHDEPLLDPETTKYRAIGHVESYHDRYRPHEAVGNRVPAVLMGEFFQRSDDACDNDEKVMKAA